MHRENNNIPGGIHGPGNLLWVVSCHGIRLKGHTGQSTSHWDKWVLINWQSSLGRNVVVFGAELLEPAAKVSCCWCCWV
jgi:hypothetical protein